MNPNEQYHQLSEQYHATRARMQALVAQFGLLSVEEEVEHLGLQARLQRLTTHLDAARRAAEDQQVQVNVQEVLAHWQTLVDAKHGAYQAFAEAIGHLRDALEALLEVHAQQEEQVQQLPPDVQRRMRFPSRAELLTALSGRMPGAWGVSLSNAAGPFPQPSLAALTEVDPGTRALPALVLRAYNERRPV